MSLNPQWAIYADELSMAIACFAFALMIQTLIKFKLHAPQRSDNDRTWSWGGSSDQNRRKGQSCYAECCFNDLSLFLSILPLRNQVTWSHEAQILRQTWVLFELCTMNKPCWPQFRSRSAASPISLRWATHRLDHMPLWPLRRYSQLRHTWSWFKDPGCTLYITCMRRYKRGY